VALDLRAGVVREARVGLGAVSYKSSRSHEANAALRGMPLTGDTAAEVAFAAAPVTVDQCYETPTQHHNPIELFTTACAWADGKLTVWELSQNMYGFQNGLAEQLGIVPADIWVISPHVGGAFGSRGTLTQRTAIVALAA